MSVKSVITFIGISQIAVSFANNQADCRVYRNLPKEPCIYSSNTLLYTAVPPPLAVAAPALQKHGLLFARSHEYMITGKSIFNFRVAYTAQFHVIQALPGSWLRRRDSNPRLWVMSPARKPLLHSAITGIFTLRIIS